MKNFKKLLAVLVLVILLGGLTACSKTNEITGHFEDQRYVRYTYTNVGESLTFALHDAMFEEALAEEEANSDTTETTETTEPQTTGTGDGSDVETDTLNVYFGFTSYAFSNNDFAVVVMEFDSVTLLEEKLENSPALQAYFTDLQAELNALYADGVIEEEVTINQEDFINGNCLLVVITEYAENYEYFIDIFQGNLEPLEEEDITTTETSTEVSTTATTTAAE